PALAVPQGEFFTLLGPGGSGKSTLLNVTAGYVAPSAGRVFIGDADVTDLPPRRRNVGMVFQSYALFPHLDVFENVAYGLRVRRLPAAEIQRRVAAGVAPPPLDGRGARLCSMRAALGGAVGAGGPGPGAVHRALGPADGRAARRARPAAQEA